MWKRDTSLTFGFSLLGLIVTGLSRKTGHRMRWSLLSASLGHRFGESDRGGREFYVEPGHLRLARNLPRDSISSTRLAFVDTPLNAKEKKRNNITANIRYIPYTTLVILVEMPVISMLERSFDSTAIESCTRIVEIPRVCFLIGLDTF